MTKRVGQKGGRFFFARARNSSSTASSSTECTRKSAPALSEALATMSSVACTARRAPPTCAASPAALTIASCAARSSPRWWMNQTLMKSGLRSSSRRTSARAAAVVRRRPRRHGSRGCRPDSLDAPPGDDHRAVRSDCGGTISIGMNDRGADDRRDIRRPAGNSCQHQRCCETEPMSANEHLPLLSLAKSKDSALPGCRGFTTSSAPTFIRLEFTKLQGAGNHFVVVDGVSRAIAITPERARRIADRHFGVGCDQVLLVEKPRRKDADFRYRIWNANAGEVEHSATA